MTNTKPTISQKFLDAISATHAKATSIMNQMPTEALALAGNTQTVQSNNLNSNQSNSSGRKFTK